MNKYIDKLIDNPWFIRILALVLALLLFENVYEESETAVNVPQDKNTEVIEDVPVKVYYDTENLVVTGVPETVTVTLTGPRSNLTQAVTQRAFEVFVDLTEAEIGKQMVPIQIKDISDRLTAEIEPEFAEVTVQEKITKEFSVDAEFNQNTLQNGYVSDSIQIEPSRVKITGAKDVIDKITYVKAPLNVEGPITETFSQRAEILVLDENLNKLAVETEPKVVQVTVSVKALTKKVPIRLVQSGEMKNGLSIQSIALEQEEATIIAPKDILDKTDSVQVELDISNINEDTEMTLPVILPEGVVEVNPKTVNVTIEVDQSGNRTLSNLPIEITGLAYDKFDLNFVEPSNGVTSLTLTGLTDEIEQIRGSAFRIYIDVSNLGEGEHNVPLQVEGPQNVSWKLGRDTAKVEIKET